MEQKADFVEPDLAVSKDNVLFCMHDDTLERTTNVAEVFPDRAIDRLTRRDSRASTGSETTSRWPKSSASTPARWFKPEFAGQRIQTFQETIDLVRGKAGIYPELKSPELYKSRGVDRSSCSST